MVYGLWFMVYGLWFMVYGSAVVERGGNTLQSFQDFRIENGSSQDQIPALTALCVALFARQRLGLHTKPQ